MDLYRNNKTTLKKDKKITIIDLINEMISRSKEIIKTLDHESIEVYKFLLSEFNKSDVRENLVFQFVFRSFYRLDNAGLSPEFKTRFFELMQENRDNKSIELEGILRELEKYPRIKEERTDEKKGSFQFSFVTKLFNTINPEFPIYDSKVSKAIFGSSYSPTGTFENKLKVCSARHDVIKKTYSHI